MESSSFRVFAIFFSIWLFILTGHSETFGAKRIYFYENPSANCHDDQQDNADTSKNIIRGWIKSVYKENFTIEMGAKLGHVKQFSKSEDRTIILYIFISVWGILIILVLGAILYRIFIQPLIKKRK